MSNTISRHLLKQIAQLDEEAHQLWARGKISPAIETMKKAIAFAPDHPGLHSNLANFYRNASQLEDAAIHYEKAIAIDGTHVAAIAGLSDTHYRQKLYQKAYEVLTGSLARSNPPARIIITLARFAYHIGRQEEAIDMARQALIDQNTSDQERLELHFTLGGLLDKKGEYDLAFEHFQKGNVFKSTNFNMDLFEKENEKTLQFFNKTSLANLPVSGSNSERPVFVVGMPRSGTSLVERIIASHPHGAGAGELTDIPLIAAGGARVLGLQDSYPNYLSDLTTEQLAKLSQLYLNKLTKTAPQDAERVVDKLPLNSLHLGFISMLFPKARIIHCLRNPLDTLLSCFFINFGDEPNVPFAYRFEHLAFMYNLHQKTMRHWQQVLDQPVFEIAYEDLVSNGEKRIQNIIEFVGLPWDNACLRFHEGKGFTNTASFDQVRQPLYKTSVGRYKNYTKHLGPLKSMLA